MTWPFLLMALVVVPHTGSWQGAPARTLLLAAFVLALHALGASWAMGAPAAHRQGLRVVLVHLAASWIGAAGLLGLNGFDASLSVGLGFFLLFLVTPLLGTMHGILVALAHRVLRRAGHDSRERVLVTTGAWAAGLASLWPLASLKDPETFGAFPVIWTLVAVGLPLAAVVWGVVRQRRWRRWLESVAAGQVPGWAVVDEVPRDVSQLAPVVAGPPVRVAPAKARVLVWTQATHSPFREAQVEMPLALVATPPEEDAGSRRGRS